MIEKIILILLVFILTIQVKQLKDSLWENKKHKHFTIMTWPYLCVMYAYIFAIWDTDFALFLSTTLVMFSMFFFIGAAIIGDE